MSAAFTPGPWSIDEDRSDEYDGVLIVGPRPGATRFGEKDVWDIAAVRADWDFDEEIDQDVVGPIAEANARLIAAAPELYEALLLWQAYDDQDEADFAQAGPMLLYARAIDATRTALAKVSS